MENAEPVNLKDALFGGNTGHPIQQFADQENGFTAFISAILPNIYIVAGVILFLYMIFGGFILISSSGDAKKADEGKQVITNAIIGFAIIFVSYWIIQAITIITGIPIL